MQEISNGGFQRINANAAAQRALTGGKKIIKESVEGIASRICVRKASGK
ncbi:hypothetical protein MUTS15_39700 [Escherichia coli]|nr:hypothetical protein MUTS15_39700 [Escherichia coli]